MPARMTSWGATLLWMLPLGIILISAGFYGADAPLASLLLSAGLIVPTTVIVITGRQPPSLLTWFAAGVLAAFCGYGFWRGWIISGAHEYAVLIAAAAVFYFAKAGAQSSKRANQMWLFTLFAGGVLVAAGFLDFMSDPSTNFGRERPYHQDRLSAPFLSANTAATFCSLVLLQSLGQLMRHSRRIDDSDGRWVELLISKVSLPIITLLLAVSALFLTASRAGVVAAMIAAILLIGWEMSARLKRREASGSTLMALAWLFIFSAVLAAAYFLSGEMFWERMTIADADVTRQSSLSSYFDAIWYQPLFGHGLGGFQFVNDFVAGNGDADLLQGQGAAHNVYLQWMIQAGLVGATAMFGAMLVIVFRLLRGLRRRQRQRSMIRTAIVIVVFVGLHGLVDYGLEIPFISWWLAWLLGISVGTASRTGRS
jgi:O-antigen ligase